MSQQLLVVLGATGQQGGSVINSVLSDAELSQRYSLRGITRDASKPAANALQDKGVEMVTADLDDGPAMAAALNGAHTVFIMTRTIYDDQAKAREVRQGKAAVDAAVAAGAQYLILSTQCNADSLTGGKYPVDAYDAKAEIEEYVRGLGVKSAFVAAATFMQNIAGGMMAPRAAPDGSYAIANIHTGVAKFPWLDVVSDMGKFVAAVLAEPDKFNGKVLYAASSICSLDEVASLISQANGGKVVKYSVMDQEKYRSFLPPAAADAIVNMFLYIQDFGYFGKETEERVQWSSSQARGELTTMETFIAKNVKLA